MRSLSRQIPAVLGWSAFVLLLVLLLLLVGRPLATEDLWFHLKMGQVYTTQGLWPAADPMLHTAGPVHPVQHEWLFGALVYELQRRVGFQGLRVIHLLWVGGILALGHSIFRRHSKGAVPALCATAIFIVLSASRLMQFRPDLATILATLLVYRLLLQPAGPPSWGRVFAAAGVFLLWVNFHSLFAVGLALLSAALLGTWIREQMLRAPAPRKAPRLLGALLVCLVATFLNPRGVGQHLTFLTSSRDTAIWRIADEWTPFFPFHPSFPHNSISLHFLPWLLTDILLGACLWAAITGYRRFRRDPGASSLDAIDPPLFLLAGASIGAIFISIRFLWLGFFPLLFLLHFVRASGFERPRVSLGLGLFTLLLLLLFPSLGSWSRLMFDTPRDLKSYLSMPYNQTRFADPGMRFLRQTGVSGNLYNPYHLGGFLGYWLSPRLRTFIDGRTEHYPPEVMEEYTRISFRLPTPAGETPLQVLDRRQVDFFIGLGGKEYRGAGKDTLRELAGVPGWILVFRSADHAIYLRTLLRNQDNLRRITDYYAALYIPFDPQRGLDVHQVVKARPDWAVAQALLPPRYPQLLAQRESRDPDERYRALSELFYLYDVIGDGEDQVETLSAVVALRPQRKPLRRRLVQVLLAQERYQEAEEAARVLHEMDPGDGDAAALYEAVRERRAGQRLPDSRARK